MPFKVVRSLSHQSLQASWVRAADPAALDCSEPGGGALGGCGLGCHLHSARHWLYRRCSRLTFKLFVYPQGGRCLFWTSIPFFLFCRVFNDNGGGGIPQRRGKPGYSCLKPVFSSKSTCLFIIPWSVIVQKMFFFYYTKHLKAAYQRCFCKIKKIKIYCICTKPSVCYFVATAFDSDALYWHLILMPNL